MPKESVKGGVYTVHTQYTIHDTRTHNIRDRCLRSLHHAGTESIRITPGHRSEGCERSSNQKLLERPDSMGVDLAYCTCTVCTSATALAPSPAPCIHGCSSPQGTSPPLFSVCSAAEQVQFHARDALGSRASPPLLPRTKSSPTLSSLCSFLKPPLSLSLSPSRHTPLILSRRHTFRSSAVCEMPATMPPAPEKRDLAPADPPAAKRSCQQECPPATAAISQDGTWSPQRVSSGTLDEYERTAAEYTWLAAEYRRDPRSPCIPFHLFCGIFDDREKPEQILLVLLGKATDATEQAKRIRRPPHNPRTRTRGPCAPRAPRPRTAGARVPRGHIRGDDLISLLVEGATCARRSP